MRMVKIYSAKRNQETKKFELEESGRALFHQFMNNDVVEPDGRILNKVMAVCEKLDGTIELVQTHLIKFEG